MKIGIVNTNDSAGGAARAAYRLAKSLKNRQEDVSFFCNQKTSDEPWIYRIQGFANGEALEQKIQHSFINDKRTSCSNTLFSVTRRQLYRNDLQAIRNMDVINLHWVSWFLSDFSIRELLCQGKQVIWTLHDERPLTGGCHYTAGCAQNQGAHCENCIQLKPNRGYSPAANLKNKSELLKHQNITFVSPSKWLSDQVRKNEVFGERRVEVIPNSIEPETFRFIPKELARHRLNLPKDRLVLLFGAYDTGERRKGYHVLIEAMKLFLNDFEALQISSDQPPLVLCFGSGEDADWPLSVERHFLGEISSDSKLAEIYASADLFILPSLEDNLPNTIIEAMACGTPCIGFPIGGVPEMIETNCSGFLAPVVSPRGLCHAITSALADREELRRMSVRCSDLARSRYSPNLQASAYQSLFQELALSR